MAEDPNARRIARVPGHFEGMRLDQFLVEHFPRYSRRAISEVIRAGEVRVDGRRARPGLVLGGGERLELPVLSQAVARVEERARGRERVRKATLAPSAVQVLHRDDALLVVSKPPGVPMHGGARQRDEVTLLDLLKKDVLAGFRLVHRLDIDTSGVVALVRGKEAVAETSRVLREEHELVRKVYEAIVEGVPTPTAGVIDMPLSPPAYRGIARVDHEHGKRAVTHYRMLEPLGQIARLRLRIETGRTHQIRAHLAAIEHPLIVDARYGRRGGWKLVDPRGKLDARLRRTPLHATELTLPHPVTGEVQTYRSPLAPDMKYALEVLRVRAGGQRKHGEDPS